MDRRRITFVRACSQTLLMGLIAAALAGCATDGQPEKSGASSDPTRVAVKPQMCGYCNGKASEETVTVPARVENGVQVATVGISNGCYVPNVIEVKAGMPVEVTFAPSIPATGCIAMPTFKELEKKGMAKVNDATVELGALEPGTYEITCGMGTVCGAVVAK